MQITNGSVSRTYKPGDYEGRTVALSFTIDPGEDAERCTAVVAGMAERTARGTYLTPIEPTVELVAPAAVPPTPPAARTRKAPPATPPVDVPPVTPPNNAAVAPIQVIIPGSGQIAPIAASPSDPFGGATAGSGTSVVAPTGELPSPAAINPLHTDKAMQDACAAKVGPLVGDARQAMVNKMMALFPAYGSDQVRKTAAVPMDQRPAFLAALAAL